jgi:alkylation response protein AidB-like acyl-CoA dehydrogenase
VNFGFNEEQDQLRAAVADFLKNETPTAFARQMLEQDAGMTDEVWRKMAQLGWMGLTVPEAYGGSGLGLLDLAIVAEEMGGVVLPGPYFSTVALALPAIVELGTDEERERLLPAIADGSMKATVAWVEADGVWRGGGFGCRAESDGARVIVNGQKLFVSDARSADVIFVVADGPDGTGIFAIGADNPGLEIRPMTGMDETRKLDVVTLNGVAVDASARLGGRVVERAALDRLLDIAKTMLAAEMCGAAAAVVDLSVEYAKIREQFGRPIATFQALQHKMADMKVALENARSLTYYAAWALDNGAEDARLACAMAKAYASEACVGVVAEGIQVHGGIGFTWEHDAHLYFKRVKSGELTFGDATANREIVAELLAV